MRIFVLALSLFGSIALAADIKPFSSDGCSSFPDGTLVEEELWLPCCEAHDYAYWKGGTRQQRHKADMVLQQCVASTGEEGISFLMLAGVRVGGTPYFPTQFRWGYGWPYLRGYQALSSEEAIKIKKMSSLLD